MMHRTSKWRVRYAADRLAGLKCPMLGIRESMRRFCISTVFLGDTLDVFARSQFSCPAKQRSPARALAYISGYASLGLGTTRRLASISPLTLEEWFSEGMAPPAAFLALAVLFDARRQISGRMGDG